MKPILIVNADDFGMTEGHNSAILEGYRQGIVTSASLLANGMAFDQAVALAKQEPGLGVGVHLTLTEGLPVSDEMRTQPGMFPLSNQPFVRALIAGQLPRDAIRCEFEAQVSKVIAAGIKPTHLDGHKYIHVLPGISTIAAQIAYQFDIPAMRVPYPVCDGLTRIGRLPGLTILSLLGRLARGVAMRAGLRSSDRVLGFVDTGHLNEQVIRRLLSNPQAGSTELICHPAHRGAQLDRLLGQGYRWIADYGFESETRAVSDPQLRRELVSWSFTNFAAL